MRWWPGKDAPPPVAVRRALEAIFGPEAAHLIGEVRVVEHSLFARLHGGAVATTRRRCIFLRGSAAEFFGNPSLMLHEYCHVLRQWEPGLLTTPRYLRECLRRGYWNNCFEIEARQFARAHERRLGEMLCEAAGEAGGAVKPQSAASRAPRVNLGTGEARSETRPDGRT
jgi:hypothetical protein